MGAVTSIQHTSGVGDARHKKVTERACVGDVIEMPCKGRPPCPRRRRLGCSGTILAERTGRRLTTCAMCTAACLLACNHSSQRPCFHDAQFAVAGVPLSAGVCTGSLCPVRDLFGFSRVPVLSTASRRSLNARLGSLPATVMKAKALARSALPHALLVPPDAEPALRPSLQHDRLTVSATVNSRSSMASAGGVVLTLWLV